MENCLDIQGDGDEIDLIEHVEHVFDVQLSDTDLIGAYTVGDLFDLIVKEKKRDGKKGKACLYAAAFFRLRGALRRQFPGQKFDQDTPLDGLVSRSQTGALWADLSTQTGLQLPAFEISFIKGVLVLVIFAVFFCGALFPSAIVWLSILAGLIFALLVAFQFSAVPQEARTLGALAQSVAAENFGKLSQDLDTFRTVDAWAALIKVLGPFADAEVSITRATRLLDVD